MRSRNFLKFCLISLLFLISSTDIIHAGTCTSTSNFNTNGGLISGCKSGFNATCTTGTTHCVSNTYSYCPGGGYPNTTCQVDINNDTGEYACNSGSGSSIIENFPCCNPAQGDICGGGAPTPGNGGNNSNPTATPTTTGATASPTVSPTASPVYITGQIQNDIDAAVSGTSCTQASDSPLNLTGISLTANKDGVNYPGVFTYLNTSLFHIDTSYSGSDYTVTLNLAGQSGSEDYACSCPAPVNPSNPYLCSYSGVGSPGNVNFYLKKYNLSNDSWFQVFGGNMFSQININSQIPYVFCAADASCQAALLVPLAGSANKNSSGFPITNASATNSIRSSASSNVYHSYLHPSDRPSNINSYGVDTNLAPLSYDYFYKLAENSMQNIGDGENLEPLLGDWTNSAWQGASEITSFVPQNESYYITNLIILQQRQDKAA